MEIRSKIVSPESSSVTSSLSRENDRSTTSVSLLSPLKMGLVRNLSLREVWEIYIKAVKSQDQSADNVKRQSQLLNLLLHLCIEELGQGDLTDFSEMKSVCNQLCKEFMSDILHITSKSEEEDYTELQKYLLTDRGWLLLQVIFKKGVKNISGGREFATLLASLLPWCMKFPLTISGGQNEELGDVDLPSVSYSFQSILKTSHSKCTKLRNQAVPPTRNTHRSPAELSSKQENDSSSGKKKFSKRKSADLDLKRDSDAESSENKEVKARGKHKRKCRYYNIHSLTDRKAQKTDSDTDDDDLNVLLKNINLGERTISSHRLCTLILGLLYDLSLSDLAEKSPGKPISSSILPFLLQCLSQIEKNCEHDGSETLDKNVRIFLQRHILRVIYCCCGVIAVQLNGLNILIGYKIVEQILSVVQKMKIERGESQSDSEFYSTYGKEFELIFDAITGIFLSLTVAFENLPFNLTAIKSAMNLMQSFDEHHGFQVMKACILYHDWMKCESGDTSQYSSLNENEPIRVFGTFLSTLKVVRVNYIHSMKCVKRKHQKCIYAQYFDHHHDILGVPSRTTLVVKDQTQSHSESKLDAKQPSSSSLSSDNSQPVCLVSSCTDFLLELLVNVYSKVTHLDLLKTIYTSGICCCMDLEHIVEAFKVAVTKCSPAVRTFALDTLSRIILEHFSGGLDYGNRDSLMSLCSHCVHSTIHVEDESMKEFDFHEKAKLTKLNSLKSKGFDSGIDSCEPTQDRKVWAFYKISMWKPVGKLHSLLYIDNETIATSVAKHLMVLAIKGNAFLKAELFFSVYYHTLDAVKKGSNQTENQGHSLSKPVQVHCLSALPFLLQANCVTKAFLSKHGVQKLCDLLEDEVLRPPVLRIFEALVVLDEQKSEVTQTTTSDCPCPYRGGQVIDAFISELSKRSFDKDEYDDYLSKTKSGRIRRDSVVLSKFSLPVLVDLWKTCAKLCLSSRGFVAQFQEMQFFRKTEILLLETLDILICPNMATYIHSQGSTETEDSGLEGEVVSTGSEVDLSQDSNGFFMRISLLESLIVAIGGCQKYMAIKGPSNIRTWEKIQRRFKDGVRLEPTKLKVLLDAILNACMPQYFSVLEFSYSRNIALVYTRDDDVYDEDEVRQLLQTGSDEEREISTEIGYDADSESTHFDDDDEKVPTERIIKCYCPQKVYFPSVFKLLFEMLVVIKAKDSSNVVVNSILHKLIQHVRADVQIVKAMSEKDVLSVILDKGGFWDCLVKKEAESIVQDSLLALIQNLGQHKMEASDFQKILQLFQHSAIPVERLLSMLLNIIENSHIKANHMVTFPIQSKCTLQEEEEVLTESGAFDIPSRPVHPFMRSVSNLVPAVNSLFMAGVPKVGQDDGDARMSLKYQKNRQEVWRTCAIKHHLRDSLTWPPFQNGFTIALWLCIHRQVKQYFNTNTAAYSTEEGETDKSGVVSSPVEKFIHMVSIGTHEKLLEIWVDTETCSVILRLTSEVSEMGLVLRETLLSGVLCQSRWQHVVVSYVEGLDGSTLTGKVNLVIDGWQNHSFILDYPFSAVKSRHKSASKPQPVLCIGQADEDLTLCVNGHLCLGNMSLFKGAGISKEICFHLFTLGPNSGSLMKCDCSEEMAMYAPYINKNTVLHSKIQYDALVGLRKPDLTQLRLSLILTYDPQKPEEISIYPPVLRNNQGQNQGQMSYMPDSLLSQQPVTVLPQCQGHFITRTNSSLEKAVYMSGGISAILFLVAKVYEKCPEDTVSVESEKIQSEAQRLLFAVIHHSSSLEQEYINIGGHALLGKVLTSCRSVVGKHVLKVLMDAATTESLFKLTGTNREMSVRAKSDAIIRDISVIEQLVLQWQIWGDYGQDDVVGLLFSALANLVREDHPHQTFNIKQFQSINLINKVFKIYQERIQDGFPALPVHVGSSVVSIVHSMTGSPPDYHLILDICDFLLLVHPAANTYINHSKSEFFFNLAWGLPPSPLTQWKKGLVHEIATSTPVKPTRHTSEIEPVKAREDLSKAFDSITVQKPSTAYANMQSGLIDMDKNDICSSVELKTTGSKDDRIADTAFSDTAGLEGNVDGSIKQLTVENPDLDIQTRTDSANSVGLSFKVVVDSPEVKTSPERIGVNSGLDLTEFDNVDRDKIIADFVNHADKSPSVPGGFESLYKKSGLDDGFETGEGADDQLEMEDVIGDQISSDDTSDNGSEVTSKDGRTLSLKFDEDNVELLKQEEGLTALCIGLLRLLSETIQIMPDSLVEKTFTRSMLNPAIFIVLGQNSSSEVREVVIHVISSYLSRCDTPHLEMFLKLEGFHLLSAQLYQYPTHQEQMEAALSILMQRSFKIHEDFQLEDTIDELSRVQQSVITLLVALLGKSTGDLALCHNSLQLFSRLFKAFDIIATVLIEQGIIEVLCNMLKSLLDEGTRDTDVEGMDENEILLSDLLNFFKVIAEREFSASGPQHYQRFEDILIILQEMEKKEDEISGLRSKSKQIFRMFQHHILISVIDTVEKASEEISQQSFSFFSKAMPKTAPVRYDMSSSLVSSLSQPFTHRHPSHTQQSLSLSGNFGQNLFRKKSPGGYFNKADQPFLEMFTNTSSGGDSDSSQDSLQLSSRTVNFPLTKKGTSQHRSLDITQGRLARSNSLLQTVFSIGKRKKLATIRVSQKELIDRLIKLICVAVDTCIFSEKAPTEKKTHLLFESTSHAVTMEREYLKKLFTFLYRGFETTLPPDKKEYKRNKNVIMWGAKDVLRVQLGRLLCYSLSGRQEFELRIYTLSFIMGEDRGKEILKILMNTQDLGNDLAYFVRDMLIEGKKWMSKQQAEDGARLLNLLSSDGYQVISPRSEVNREQAEILNDRKKLIDVRFDSHKVAWLKKKEMSLNRFLLQGLYDSGLFGKGLRIFHQYDSLSSRLSDKAMEVTQFVTHLQHQERTKFVTHIKQKRTESIQVKKHWQEIVQNLTHERAVWFDEMSYPQSWQLNSTEGPCRVRKRLQRGHLQILPKFLKREFQDKLVAETVDPPLIYLFEDDHQMSDSAALIYQLHKNKKIRYTCSCRAVSPNSESKGELLIGEDSVFFVADEAISDANYTQVLLGNKDQLSMTWPFEDVLEIHKRWYELTDTALEIFLTNGKTCLLALRSTKERDDLYQHLMMLELPNQRELCGLLDTMIKWQEGTITNFEYLTQLNKLAGRSFNDLMQYPIMPFILSDYTSNSIDLRDETIYRNLQKPVSVQDPKNEQKFKTNYMILKQEYDKFGKGEMTGLSVAPYHYGSHYSNSGSVLHYLVRLPPFTKMFLNFQDQSFDIPDRTFHNLHTSWRLSSAESNTDVKELIPEFFFTHEFLTNSEGFDFGKRQNGKAVDDVVLPPWCEGNPRLFILIHRQALESDHVTEYIPDWIDLVFGFKQTGEAAVKAVNVFHPATYFGLDVTSVRNSVDRKAIQTMVRTYGQTPKKLFTTCHPKSKHESRHEYHRNQQHALDSRVKNVMGLKWGSYLGSLDKPQPAISWEWNERSSNGLIVGSLVALPNGEVFGIGERSCLLIQHSLDKTKALPDYLVPDVVWAAIVTWGQTNGIIKIINNIHKPPVNLINHSQTDQIKCCVSMPDCRYLFVGGQSGVITIYNTKYNLAKESQIQVFGHKRYLYGHTDAITCLEVCKPYSTLVSGSQDSTCIIWDLNRLSYVRTVHGHESGVQAVAVSETLGDIASVSHHGMGSYLFLHTVNAEFVTMVTCEETINCLAYSNAPEGKSINVIAGGLSTGTVRMWSSWDLTPVRDLTYTSLTSTPIVSLTFTIDSQRLYCSSVDGRVFIWDYAGHSKLKSKFTPHLFDI